MNIDISKLPKALKDLRLVAMFSYTQLPEEEAVYLLRYILKFFEEITYQDTSKDTSNELKETNP